MMKPIVTDNYDFERMIEEGYTYVDKTDVLEALITEKKGSQFFLSRPRRFGKSLTINTLKWIFQGRKDLFKGTAIGRSKTYDWKKYPVIHLDLSNVVASTPEQLNIQLCSLVEDILSENGLKAGRDRTPSVLFRKLIHNLAAKSKEKRVVVLIDEYDAPVNGFVDDPEKLVAFRDVMHQFFLTLKANVEKIRFLMATGVTRFTKVSLFSCLNNPTDLTMDARTARLCGYTPEEIEKYFHGHIQTFADKEGISYEAMFAKLLDWYDSYRFSPESEVRVCNPVSFGKALVNQVILNYWESTGLAASAVRQIRESKEIISDWNNFIVSRTVLDASDQPHVPLVTLLFQTGYLTIDRVTVTGQIALRVPNREVLDSMNEGMMSNWLGGDSSYLMNDLWIVKAHLLEKGMDFVLEKALASCYARIPHEWTCRNEAEAKRFFQLYCYFLGARIKGEHEVATGRPDAVIEHPNGVYILEFKYGKTSASAMKQIRERKYADAYRDDARPVWLVGCNYNPRRRGLDKPLVKRAAYR